MKRWAIRICVFLLLVAVTHDLTGCSSSDVRWREAWAGPTVLHGRVVRVNGGEIVEYWHARISYESPWPEPLNGLSIRLGNGTQVELRTIEFPTLAHLGTAFKPQRDAQDGRITWVEVTEPDAQVAQGEVVYRIEGGRYVFGCIDGGIRYLAIGDPSLAPNLKDVSNVTLVTTSGAEMHLPMPEQQAVSIFGKPERVVDSPLWSK